MSEISTGLDRVWGIDDATLNVVRQLRPIIDRALAQLDECFYEALFAETSIRLLMRDTEVRQRAIVAMARHWSDLLSGELTDAALVRAMMIGKRHFELGVDEQYFLLASQRVMALIVKEILAADIPNPAEAIETVIRLVMLNVSLSLKAQAEAAIDVVSAIEVRRETTGLRKELKAAEHLAYADGLTGLFNRRYFDQTLAAAIAHALRHARPLCVIVADIDRFKVVNDEYGHAIGDRVLRQLASTMAGTIRLSDVLVRYGGEEFAVILPETGVARAVECAERLRIAAERTSIRLKRNSELGITLSLGVAAFNRSESAESLVCRADQALYRAKQTGRNRVVRAARRLNKKSSGLRA